MIKVSVIEDDLEIGKLIEKRINGTEIAFCSGIFIGPKTYLSSKPTDQIVLLDVVMPEMNGLDAIPKLLDYDPDLIIIMNTIKNDSDIIFNAIRAGAMGYIDKQSTSVDYSVVFTSVLRGGAFLTPSIALKVIKYFKTGRNNNTLTSREIDVAAKIKEGNTYDEVAQELNISINTVRMHIKNIYSKLQINSKHELMHMKF